MNMGYEDDELKPYIEPQPDLNDQKRIGKTGTVQQQRFIIDNFNLLVVFSPSLPPLIYLRKRKNSISF